MIRARVISEEEFAQMQQRVKHANPAVLGEAMHAVRRRAPSHGFKSKLELRYSQHLEMLVKLGEIRRWAYEPMRLQLGSGKSYRPDFLVVLPYGKEAKAELHEVKGKWTKNRRDGLTHLAWAAQKYGDVFTFRLIEWTGNGFNGTYIAG